MLYSGSRGLIYNMHRAQDPTPSTTERKNPGVLLCPCFFFWGGKQGSASTWQVFSMEAPGNAAAFNTVHTSLMKDIRLESGSDKEKVKTSDSFH